MENSKFYLYENMNSKRIPPSEQRGYISSDKNNDGNCFGCHKFLVTQDNNSFCSKNNMAIPDDLEDKPIKPDNCIKITFKIGMLWSRTHNFWNRRKKEE